MTTSYPSAIDAYERPDPTDPQSSPAAYVVADNLMDAVEALETKVGVDGSADTDSIEFILKDPVDGHNHDGTNSAPADAASHNHGPGGVGSVSHDDLDDVTANQHHNETHAMSSASHSGAMGLQQQGEEFATQAADVSRTSTVALSATGVDLNFDVEANENCFFRFMLVFTGAVAGDLSIDLTGPAAVTDVWYQLFGPTEASAGPATNVQQNTMAVATAFSTQLDTGAAGQLAVAWIEGYLDNGANSGTVQLRFAQRASSGTATTIRKGSYVFKKKVN